MNKINTSETSTDPDLLREFVANGCETSFRLIVERHASMVFSVALRRAGQWELAEEVAQNVFRKLAQKAGNLSSDVVLTGWLHKAALFEAATLQRAEATRIRIMNEAADATADDHESELTHDLHVWAELSPIIDSALEQLPSTDRDVVLLRYYQSLTYREIGDHLGKTESAARKHTLRALNALSSLLKKQSVTFPATALGAGIAYGFASSAPPGFAKALATSFALEVTPASAGVATASISMVTAAAVICCAIPMVVQWHLQDREAKISASQSAVEPPGASVAPAKLQDRNKNNSEQLNLDTVFAAKGSERLRLLGRWLPLAGQDEVRDAANRLAISLWGMNSSVSNHNSHVAWSVVFARWAELDPSELLEFARGAKHPRYRHLDGTALVRLAFRAWASVDRPAALSAAGNENPEVLAGVIATFQLNDPESAIEASADLPPFSRHHGLDWTGMFEQLAQRDPAAAVDRVRAIKDSITKEKALMGVLAELGKQDLESAMALVNSLDDFRARETGRASLLADLIGADPDSALSMIADLPPGISRPILIRKLARRIAGTNPANAKVWADSLVSPQDRRAAFTGMALEFAKSDPFAAFDALDKLNWNLQDLEGIRNFKPRSSGGLAQANPGGSLQAVAATLISQLAETDPASALRYASKISSEGPTHLFDNTARKWAQKAPIDAKLFAASLEDGPFKNQLAVHVARVVGSEDASEAMAWAMQLGGRAGDLSQVAVFNSIAAEDPVAASGLIAGLPDIVEKGNALDSLVRRWADRDFDAALQWVRGQDKPDAIAPAVRAMVNAWARRDPLPASQWVGQLPEGPAMQHGVGGLVQWMVNVSNMDHEAAFAWTTKIDPNNTARHFYLEIIAKDWLEHDFATGAAALEAMDLPTETKVRLLKRAASEQSEQL